MQTLANVKRGVIKVMNGRRGGVRIQEEVGDSVKVYTLTEWNEELARRAKGETAKAEKPTKPVTKAKEPKALAGATKPVKAEKPAKKKVK